jgi:5'-AMP-activated protein kinase, regulatory gamma subunit
MIFNLLRPFLGAGTSCTLYRACTQLLLSNHDFLPIVFLDDMRVLSCITYTTILEHLVTHFREQRRLFDDSVADLHIGTYGTNVISITTQHTLRDAIQLMSTHSLSALPVLDATTNKILAMYSRSDITFLTRAVDAEDAVRNLNLTLYDILNASNTNNTIPATTTTASADPTTSSSSSTPPVTTSSTGNTGQTPPLGQQQQQQSLLHPNHQYITTPDALRTCQPTHTLQAIFESFAIQRFNRLCVIDENEQLLGIVSAKDLVAYFLSDTIPSTLSSTTTS